MLKIFPALLLSLLLVGCFPPAQRSEQFSDATTEQSDSVGLEVPQEETAGQLVAPLLDGSGCSTVELPAAVAPGEDMADVDPVASSPLPYFGDFPLSEHPRIDKLVTHYTGSGRRTFGTWLKRAGRFIPDIQKIFAEEGVPLDLAYLALIESGFNPRAYSWAHAAGPWQFIESTGNIYNLTNDWWRDERCDLEKSTRAAARHLKYLHKRFDGDWYLAVAAYNAGGGKVRRAVRESDSRDFWVLIEGKVLREETRNYLPKLLAALTLVKGLESYGFAELDFAEPLSYETVTVETSTDLELVARLCDISYAELKALNPNLKRWSTPPQLRDYPVHVPFGKAEQFRTLYAELPKDQRASYHRHQVKPGDSLLALAKKYHIQVDDIITLNSIKNPRALQIGADLILPLKEGFSSLPVDELADQYVRSRRKTYTVRAGDSLWTIANRFDVTEKQLRVWNKLGWSNLIKPGQTLAVSARGKGQVAKARREVGPSRKLIYKVVSGDTLWGISRQFDVETEMIQIWNDLSSSHILRPGQTLTLMVPASRQG